MAPEVIAVWLAVGRKGRIFTYKDGKCLGVDLGDIVSVRLKGRLMNGLVVGESQLVENQSKKDLLPLDTKRIALSDIETIVQKAAVDESWRKWLEETARQCYTTPFRMLKAAMPPGWLGYKKSFNLKGRELWWVSLNTDDTRVIPLFLRHKQLKEFLLAQGGGIWQKNLIKHGFSSGLVKSALETGLLTREKRTLTTTSEMRRDYPELEKPRILTEEQKIALNFFSEQPPASVFLLWGVTGSGKTEVYLQMVEKELKQRRHCLVLTPEIGLIPQLVDRFVCRFGQQVLEYHSGCSDKERNRTWQRALTSLEPLVIIGTRSAIFLPLAPLGLIVLDEEHDSSYKQESPMPCYHARDLAIDRAQRTGAKVVLGSATPSLATWKNLAPKGSIKVMRLTQRIENKPLPSVVVIDMRRELAQGHRRLISRPLLNRLSKLREDEDQAVILVPRRGHSSFLSCRSCGEVIQCPNCDVSLTVHQNNAGLKWLRCHWCDYQASIGLSCNTCGSKAFKPFGAGTQKVIEHLTSELSDVRLLRFDRDSIRGRDGHRRLLERFAAGEADVLIGTQMLAKGMDLPRVTLAVVLAADGLLHRPDLLACEQTLQLFMQLAGRAGRGERPGEVLVQTYTPDHPVIGRLVDGSYEEFLREEAKIRELSGLVPYCRACLLRLSSESASFVATTATALAEYIRPNCKEQGWLVVGPAPALVERVAGKYRWQILLHGPESSSLPLPKDDVLWRWLPKGVNLSVDPDPIQL